MRYINKLLTNPNIIQVIKFCIVGVLNTVVFYAVYYLLLQLGFNYIVSATVGTIAGIVNSYVFNKFFTFKSKRKSIDEIIKFCIVCAVQFFSNLGVIYVCVNFIGLSEELAGIPPIFTGMFISFLGHKFWSFKKQ
ncbi:MAG: GtrA family protein [Oscillospiraceae bacterium]|jgi:putative flippase GtrA|nr:GtrA family protein [Oscillospiraceae bacterium]